MIYIGIDGGPSGGIVALSPCAGLEPILTAPMPTVKQGKAVLVDGRAVVSLLRNLPWAADGLHVAIEDLPHHSMSKAAMRSMALNFGRLTGAIEARLQSDRVTVDYVPAGNAKASWQRAMLSVEGAGTKAAALTAAGLIWPGFNWVQPGCRKPSDGIIDAALIAEHARRRIEGFKPSGLSL